MENLLHVTQTEGLYAPQGLLAPHILVRSDYFDDEYRGNPLKASDLAKIVRRVLLIFRITGHQDKLLHAVRSFESAQNHLNQRDYDHCFGLVRIATPAQLGAASKMPLIAAALTLNTSNDKVALLAKIEFDASGQRAAIEDK